MVATEVTKKIEALSTDDYNMVIALIDRLSSKPTAYLENIRKKHLNVNPMSMDEINAEIEKYRSEKHA